MLSGLTHYPAAQHNDTPGDPKKYFKLKITARWYDSVFAENLLSPIINWTGENLKKSYKYNLYTSKGFSDKKLRGFCFITAAKDYVSDSAFVEVLADDTLTIIIPDDGTKLAINFIVDPIPYHSRLLMVEQLSKQYALPAGKDEKGYWSGIYYFSKWQFDSGRDLLPIWERVNRSFTMNPYLLSQFLKKDSAFTVLPMHPGVKAKWNKIFTQEARKKQCLQLLWKAHAAALAEGMQNMEKEVENLDIPEDEIRFWRGRVKVIFFLGNLNFPTVKKFIVPIINVLEPPCSPLGLPGCEIRDMNTGIRKLYVQLLRHLGRKKIDFKTSWRN